ncbi:MAG: tetraacyldisaccharide 4'-kinase [Deltaproteobacteria bacterium]|nr:tetraacyldisaccharide 4'-kinase [Candidatus Anaeroferrophillacea bacterium]
MSRGRRQADPHGFDRGTTALLRPLALTWRIAVAGRNLPYDLGLRSGRRLPVPVVCVGNLTVGGTGKTPMVEYLVRHFRNRGLVPGILSRGYGRRRPREPRAVGPGRPAPGDPSLLGDEATLLHERLPDVPLVLDADRVRGGFQLITGWQTDIIVMDDGFQHRRLARTANVVLVDSQQLFGTGRLLPAGPLREPLSALDRADLVVFTRFDQRHPGFGTTAAEIAVRVPAHRLFSARQMPAGGMRLDGRRAWMNEELDGRRAAAFAGIGNPEYFFAQLRALGAALVTTRIFADHHRYTAGDLKTLTALAQSADLLITTAKDAVKLRHISGINTALPNLAVLETVLAVDREHAFLRRLEQCLRIEIS